MSLRGSFQFYQTYYFNCNLFCTCVFVPMFTLETLGGFRSSSEPCDAAPLVSRVVCFCSAQSADLHNKQLTLHNLLFYMDITGTKP